MNKNRVTVAVRAATVGGWSGAELAGTGGQLAGRFHEAERRGASLLGPDEAGWLARLERRLARLGDPPSPRVPHVIRHLPPVEPSG